MIRDTFKGKNRWLSVLVFIYIFLFFGLSIYCAVEFFSATEVKHWIAWAIGFLFCQLTVCMLKIWYWMEMQKNSLTREIKRLELQIVHLVDLMKKDND